MVALKTGKLSDRDIWPDLLWTDKEWHAKRDEIEAHLRSKGLKGPDLLFAISKAMAAFTQPFPKWGERQKIMRRLYPPVARPASQTLTDEERDYLIERLSGANDDVGQSILRKLVQTLLIVPRG
jgi:hypothetical protein